ncbi:MAG: arginase family protein [Candidatus Bipolaricaulia bacterium]
MSVTSYKLLGCPLDNAIRSMLRYGRGLTGAADGPQAVWDALKVSPDDIVAALPGRSLDLAAYNLAVDRDDLHDAAFIERQLECTLQAHATIEQAVEDLVRNGQIPIGIGGDHSVTYPLARGLMARSCYNRWGLVYIDAHLDLRAWGVDESESVVSSGNAFWRLLNDPSVPLSGANVVALGIQRSDTDVYRSLARRAGDYGLTIVDRPALRSRDLDAVVAEALDKAGRGTDAIYLSLDMDAFDAGVAPGVSAPNAHGLSEAEGLSLVDGLARDPRVTAMDVVETSSRETAWFEIVEDRARDESPEARSDKLAQTARVAADTIRCFIDAKTDPWARQGQTG